MYACRSKLVNIFNLRPNFELYKRRHYPIIPTGMRYNIKGEWQPAGHRWESFHWFIIYTVTQTLTKATKITPELRHLPYTERLKVCKLPTLRFRQV